MHIFFQMNNLKELAADKMNSSILVLTTFCGELYHSPAQLIVPVLFGYLRTGANGQLSQYMFDLRFCFIMAAKC